MLHPCRKDELERTELFHQPSGSSMVMLSVKNDPGEVLGRQYQPGQGTCVGLGWIFTFPHWVNRTRVWSQDMLLCYKISRGEARGEA